MQANATRHSSSQAWYVVALLGTMGIVSYLDRLALGLLIQPVKAELGITDTQVGLLLGPSFALLFAIAGLPIAIAVDKWNRKWLLVGGVTIWSLATSASAFAHDFTSLFVLRMGVGVGEAALTPVAVSMIGDLFTRDRRSVPMSTMIAFQAGGAGASALIVAMLIRLATTGSLPLPGVLAGMAVWRVALFMVGPPGLLLALVAALTLREPTRSDVSAGVGTASADGDSIFKSAAAERKFFALLLLATNCTALTLLMVANWFPTFLIRTYGLPPERVGYAFGPTLMVGGVLGSVAIPLLVRRLVRAGGPEAILRIAVVATPIAAVLFLIAVGMNTFGATMAIVALFFLVGNSVGSLGSVLIAGVAGARRRGKYASANMLGQAILGSSLGPFAVGFLSDRWFAGSLAQPLAIVGGISGLLSTVLMLLARRAYACGSTGSAPRSSFFNEGVDRT